MRPTGIAFPALLISVMTLAACTDPSGSIRMTSAPSAADLLEMTIKGPEVAELGEDPGSCPDGFKPIQTPKGDANGNGWVCYNGFEIVDDILTPEGAETQFAGGHGNFVFDKQDISFSFHGKQNKQMVVKGEFEMHDQTNDLRIHGSVTCLSIEGNLARLGGVVEQSTDPSLPVGLLIAWRTVDNGEGINEPVDLLSRPSIVGKDPKKECQRAIKFNEVKIQSGNIQVLH
jgi:hypothetical protein